MIRASVAIVAALLMALALWMLLAQTRGLDITRTTVGTTPVTVHARVGAPPAPAVVIAHGFAGSQQLMQPFAVTLARAGYVAVSYDALGHGRNPVPLTGDVTSAEGATARLVAQIVEVLGFARTLPQADGRLALLGHSMASDIVVRAAKTDPAIAATVAVSLFSPEVTADAPQNLLIITGAWEPGLAAEALRVAGLAAGGDARPFETWGDPAQGTGRRAVLSPGVEHVGVLFSATSLREARDWLDAAFGRDGGGGVDRRAPWLGLWFAGALALAWGVAPAMPRIAQPAAGSVRWRRFLLAAVLPALLTPPLAWTLPRDLLPVPVADYLSVHFLVYGILTAALLAPWRRRPAAPLAPFAPGRIALAALAYVGFGLATIHLPLDQFVTSFVLPASRLALFAMLLAGLAIYFLADEHLTRGPAAPRGAYALTKLCFLGSLVFAIALDPERLFFLILILPVTVLSFVVFGLLSRWSHGATGSPTVGAIGNAALFGWALAVTFPIVLP